MYICGESRGGDAAQDIDAEKQSNDEGNISATELTFHSAPRGVSHVINLLRFGIAKSFEIMSGSYSTRWR